MQSILIGFCVTFFTNIVFSQGSFGGTELATIHTVHPMKYWIEETKTAYNIDDAFIIKGHCREVTCTKQEGDILLSLYRGCPMSRHQTDCQSVVKQPELEFPARCPELVC